MFRCCNGVWGCCGCVGHDRNLFRWTLRKLGNFQIGTWTPILVSIGTLCPMVKLLKFSSSVPKPHFLPVPIPFSGSVSELLFCQVLVSRQQILIFSVRDFGPLCKGILSHFLIHTPRNQPQNPHSLISLKTYTQIPWFSHKPTFTLQDPCVDHSNFYRALSLSFLEVRSMDFVSFFSLLSNTSWSSLVLACLWIMCHLIAKPGKWLFLVDSSL